MHEGNALVRNEGAGRILTSVARGSSGLGADKSACMDKRTVRIWSAGDHLSGGRTHVSLATAKIGTMQTLENIKADPSKLVFGVVRI